MKRMIYGLIVLLLVTLFDVYSFCLDTAAAVFSESIKTSLQISELSVSLAVGAFIIGYALMQIPAGFLLDKYNSRYVVSGGILLMVAGNIAISFTNNVVLFSICNLIQGIGASFAFTAVAIATAQWFPEKLFPVLLGLTQTLSCILTAVIHYMFAVGLAAHTWNEIYRVLSFCGIGLFLLTLIFVKSPADSKKHDDISLITSLGLVCKNPQIWLCMFAATLSYGILLAYASFWYLDVQKFYSVRTLDAVTVSGMMFVGAGIGMPILGWISNRVKSRKMVIHVSLCLGAMFLLMCLYLPHYQINTLAIIKTVTFITGFLLSGSMLFFTVASEISSDRTRGLALSATNMGAFLFSSVMMFVPYVFITNVSNMFFTYLWVLPFCIIIAILLNYFIRESYLAESPPHV